MNVDETITAQFVIDIINELGGVDLFDVFGEEAGWRILEAIQIMGFEENNIWGKA